MSVQALAALIKTADGDLRRAITYLQSASRLHAASKTPLTALSVQEIGGVVPDSVLRALGRALGVDGLDEPGEDVDMETNKGGKGAFEILQTAVVKVCREGYSATQVLSQLHDLLIGAPLLSARAKASIALTLGETDKSLTDGADEEMQLLAACARIRRAVVAAA